MRLLGVLDDEMTPTGSTPPANGRWEEERAANPLFWWATLIGPPLSFVALVVGIGILRGWELARAVVGRAVVSFFITGRISILEPTESVSAEGLFFLVTYMDVAAGLFIAPHVGFLFGLPYVGRRLHLLVEDSEALLSRAEDKRWLTFLALVLFVFIPVTATGSVGGAVLGRLLGLSRTLTITAVLVGSVVCNALMYGGSSVVRQYVSPDAWGTKVIGATLTVGFLYVLNRRYQAAARRARKRRDERRARSQSGG